MTTTLSPLPVALDLDAINARLASSDATGVVSWAYDTFGSGLVMTSSFGAQAAVMLHLVSRVVPDIPVILIDTGYLFPETYRFVDELTQRLKLNLRVYSPTITAARLEAMHGLLWETNHDQYGQFTKIEPLQRAVRELGATAWLSGVRGQQTSHRAAMKIVEGLDRRYGLYPIHPIVSWTTRDVHQYLKAHELPYHPLYEKGYASIGDTHSTRPITDGMNERDGRFGGLKQECGLHMPASNEEIKSREGSSL